jgi:hypothetical protein
MPIKNDEIEAFRLKQPCGNCPFRKKGAISLRPCRLNGIIKYLVSNDHSTFPCHKTTRGPEGGAEDDEGQYVPSGHEAICAGSIAYLMKIGREPLALRLAFRLGYLDESEWDKVKELVIDFDPEILKGSSFEPGIAAENDGSGA